MKKTLAILLVLGLVLSFTSVYADSFENKTYSFESVKSTAVFSEDGTYKRLNGVDILLFENAVTMQIAGDALNGMICPITVTELTDDSFECLLPENMVLSSKIFNEGKFPETTLPNGSYLLFLDSAAGGYSTLVIIVGKPEIVNKATVFGEDALISSWAENELLQAYILGLLTQEIYEKKDYTRNITRGEFAHIMSVILVNSGIDYNAYVASLGENYTPKFTDTDNDLIIEFVSNYGVINGVGEGLFDPSGELTRELAATMLARLLNVMELNYSNDSPVETFADEELFSDWATESIYTVAGIKDSSAGYAVMGGVGEGNFSPKTGYTVEQAMISAKRFVYAVIG